MSGSGGTFDRTPPGPVRGDYSLLGRSHPVKEMGLDPLYGGDMNSLIPAPVRGTDFRLLFPTRGREEERSIDSNRWFDRSNWSLVSATQVGIITGKIF